ncbi:MAG: aminotransferase class III-fold pyridoxal phosphate-dependent enzyme [Candidatus Tectomicrobia bacterium]|nr:aminotransferase class III-fold pyridoxal phosphate-dependent enzyme [Candidatus Tectomicrobia bacterium]
MGNVLTCAAAHATVKYLLDHDLLTHTRQMGAELQQGLQALQAKHACVIDVRGMGLLWAVEFSTDMAAAVVAACNEVGLLLNAVRPHAIRFMPPLTVTQAEIDEAIAKLSAVLDLQTTQTQTAS